MSRTANIPRFAPMRKADSLRVKTRFVSEVLRESALWIRDAQQKVAAEWNLFESGKLKGWLQGHFNVMDNDSDGKLVMRYLTYARFLDMPDSRRRNREVKREGYHLYNRTVFGILYRRSLPYLKYGLTDDIRKTTGQALANAVGSREYAALISKQLRQGYV